MAACSNSPLAPSFEDPPPCLIFPNGGLDQAAIAAELERRMIGREPWQRAYHENQVRQQAASQRWPFVEAAIVAEWTDAEHEEFWLLKEMMYATPVTARGLAEWDRLSLRQAEIQAAVNARATARLDGEASRFAQAA